MTTPPRRPGRELAQPIQLGTFEYEVALAIGQITRNRNTADAYWRDVRHWLRFCAAHTVDLHTPMRHQVAAWMTEMIDAEIAPKTRSRRVSALCSIYRELRRELRRHDGTVLPPPMTVPNPFSVDEGPRRERKAEPLEPTPVAEPEVVAAMIATCDAAGVRPDPTATRDRAMIRVLWATGLRRSSVIDMSIERLKPSSSGDGYETTVAAKGAKRPRIWIRGRAAADLGAWLAELARDGTVSGPVWVGRRGKLTARGVAAILRRRAHLAGATGRISPHMMRVAFLTFNEAGLEARQDAAGHADPATTRAYDRAAWRGREAFAKMPEIEHVAGDPKPDQ